jgi:3-oxoacyl-[acyl-carrier-protein] synthase-3
MKYKVTLKGVGSYLPAKVVTNTQVAEKVDTTEEWIYDKLGIKERRVVEEELPSNLGYNAAINALKDASMDIEDIDMMIIATSSPEQISPPTSCVIHNKFNTSKNIPAFDINAVCSGFVYALTLAASLIESKTYKNILIISTEAYSKITNWEDQHAVFFGDGAGAVVMGPSEEGWMYSKLEANGRGTGMTGFNLPLSSTFIMRGKEVWNQAIKVLPESLKSVLKETETSIDEIKMLVPHQPSINILKVIAQELSIPMERVKTVMHKYANIAGASIPIALDEAIKDREIVEGDKIMFTAIGSGWSWGSILLYYKK